MINVSEKGILHIFVGLIITPLAGFAASWAATHLPGLPHFNSEEVTVFFTAGAAAGLAAGLHFLEKLPWFNKVVHVEATTGAETKTVTTSSSVQK